jgi:hypothetical protein
MTWPTPAEWVASAILPFYTLCWFLWDRRKRRKP